MTREEAIKKHRELWHWIADETRRNCRLVFKHENPDVAKEKPYNDCWLCEYAICHKTTNFNHCTRCPIDWGVMTCMRKGSPYRELTLGNFLYKEYANLADRIAELPEKGDE